MTLPLIDHIVYGPVRSRRLGRSLGVNLLPAGSKICNMDCAYCQYGWTRRPLRDRRHQSDWPTVEVVGRAVEARLAAASRENETIDRITIAGHGEPTLHPAFDEVVQRIVGVRDRVAPPLPIGILSNSTTAWRPDVKSGLARLDERYMKLDAGDPFTFADVNRSGVSLTAVTDALRALAPVVIQAMFVKDRAGAIDNTSDAAIDFWLGAVEAIGAARVHVYTIDRTPALETLRPVSERRLHEIAERVRRAGIPTDVFGGRLSGRRSWAYEPRCGLFRGTGKSPRSGPTS